MGWKKGNPGCPCCTCLYASQHFTSSAWTSQYTADAGDTWTQSGTVLSVTSEDAAITSTGSRTGAMWVFRPWSDLPTFDETNPDTYDFGTVDMRVRLADASNYIFLRLAFSRIYEWTTPHPNVTATHWRVEWTLQLFERIGGADTAISDAIVYSANLTTGTQSEKIASLPYSKWFFICVSPFAADGLYDDLLDANKLEVRSGVLTLTGDETAVPQPIYTQDVLYGLYGETSSSTAFGDKHGVRVDAGLIETGIDAIWVYQHDNTCRWCECTACEKGTSPNALDVTFSGMVSKVVGSGNCTEFNNLTVRLTRDDNPIHPSDDFTETVGGGIPCAMRGYPWGAYPWDEAGHLDGVCCYHGLINPAIVNGTYTRVTLCLYRNGDGLVTAQLIVYGYWGFTLIAGIECYSVWSTSLVTLGNAPVDCWNALDYLVMDTFACTNDPVTSIKQSECTCPFAEQVEDNVVSSNTASAFTMYRYSASFPNHDWTTLPATGTLTIGADTFTVTGITLISPDYVRVDVSETITGDRTGEDVTYTIPSVVEAQVVVVE